MKTKRILSLCMAGLLCFSNTPLADEFTSGEGEVLEETISQEDPYTPETLYEEPQNTDGLDFGSDFQQIVTEAPIIVTEAPIIVTEAPIIVTEAPIIVTEAPIIVTENPAVVSEPSTETTTEDVFSAQTTMSDKDVLTEEDIQELNAGQAQLVKQGERLTFLSGTLSHYPILDEQAATAAISRISSLLYMAPGTALMSTGYKSDPSGNLTWRFVQMQGTTPVEDAQVLLYTTPEGVMTGLSSSLATSLSPDAGLITKEQAEGFVQKRLASQGYTSQVLTDKTISPLMSSASLGGSTGSPAQRLWVVYSENPEMKALDAPYLAHYLTGTGIYLFNAPSSLPGAASSLQVYYPSALFQGMEMSLLARETAFQDGTSRSLSLPIVIDMEGFYALGDPGRMIAMARAEDYQGEEKKISLIRAETPEGFTDSDLLVYDAILTAFNYFENQGIYGPDGNGSGVLLLRDYKNASGEILPGISYLGFCEGWQVFAYNGSDHYGEALDVTGSVYAQCVLGSLLPTRLLANTTGRVQVALSRILGNLMEQLAQTHADPDWLFGEALGEALLSMRDPGASRQPSFVGDVYYLPDTTTPDSINRWGGVMVDSSLLELVAFSACEAGLDPYQASRLWVKIGSSLTSKTGEKELAAMIGWALSQTGLGDFAQVLTDSIQAVRLGQSIYQPTKAKEGCALVSLSLPGANTFLTSQPILALYKKGKDDSRKKALSRQPRVLSWGEQNQITFMAPTGKYYLHLLIPDLTTGQVLTMTYDGEAWHTPEIEQALLAQSGREGEEKKLDKPIRLKEGAVFSVSSAGLEGVDSAYAQLRLQSMATVQ